MSEPLRPQTLGEILDRTTQLYRARFPVFLGISLLPTAAALALSFIVGLAAACWNWYGARSFSAEAGYALIGLFSLGFGLLALPLLLGSAALAEAAMSYAVSRVYLEATGLGERETAEPVTIRGAYKSVWRRGWRYIGLFTLQVLILGVAPWIVWTVLILISAIGAAAVEKAGMGGESGFLLGLLMILFFFALTGYVIWMMVRLSLAFAASVVEQTGAGRALKRSWALSKGTKGRIFMLYLLAAILGLVLLTSLIFTLAIILQLIPATRSGHHGDAFGTILGWGFFAFAVLLQMLIKPIVSIAQVLFYYDQRIRQEGFDIEWMMLQAGMTAAAAPVPVAAPWLPAAPRRVDISEVEPLAATTKTDFSQPTDFEEGEA
jgi:hypothetical protein